jgi:hypothetical protein
VINQTIKKTFSSREDAEQWVKETFGEDLKPSPAANALKSRVQEYWNSLPTYDEEPLDECCDAIGCGEAKSTEPWPTFKPGTAMTEIGIYVDENGHLWHVDPIEGDIDLIVEDDD